MPIAVNTEGVNALKKYSSSITESVSELKTATDQMANVTDQYSGKLGPHATQINNALDTIKGAILRCTEPANSIAEKLNDVAGAYQEIIDADYYGEELNGSMGTGGVSPSSSSATHTVSSHKGYIADDVDNSSETSEINSISDYMNVHNYGPYDFITYSQDPQWRQLMRREFPDYELPEMTQESARAKLSQYMNEHNYGVGDYAEYSQDPIWRELHSTAFPDADLPPLTSGASAASSSLAHTVSTHKEYILDYADQVSAVQQDIFNGSGRSVSEREAARILHGVREFSGTAYTRIRNAYNNPYADQRDKELMQSVDEYVRSSPKWNGRIYRGINVTREQAEKIISETTVDMLGPSSWSSDYSVAERFSNGYKEVKIIFDLNDNKSGASITHIGSWNGAESEVTAPSGVIYRIDKVLYGTDDTIIISVHE